MAIVKKIEPQAGPQSQFLSTKANIAIYGGAAGSGKTYSVLLEPLRNYSNPLFRSVFFRRSIPEITNPGGIWDEAQGLYTQLLGIPNQTSLKYSFPSGSEVKFSHLEMESTVYAWQGAQIPLIVFEELTHFTEKQFFYMMSRNRSASGVPAYMRATTNPDPDSWVRKFIDWWIGEDGYPIKERSGVLRHFVRDRATDEFIWRDEPFQIDDVKSKSVTFISALIENNQILLRNDPGYLDSLNNMSLVDRMRLRSGNWNIKAAPGLIFKKIWFEIVDAVPAKLNFVRYWDRASSEKKGADFTVGLKMGKAENGLFYIVDVVRFQGSPLKVEEAILNTARQDGINCTVWLEQDPGQAGQADVDNLSRMLSGFSVEINRVTQSKEIRAKPLSAQAERGNIKLLRATWNETFLTEMESFPDPKSKDDQVDTASGAFNALCSDNVGKFTEAHVPESKQVESGGSEEW